MNIETTLDNMICTVTVEGEINTLTAPQLSQAIAENAASSNKLILNLSGVDYISSAGLRVIVAAYKEMRKKEGLVIKGINQNVKSVLDMTGLSKALTIEE